MTDNAAYDVGYATPDPLEVWSAQHFRDKFVNIPGIGKLAEKLGRLGWGMAICLRPPLYVLAISIC